MMMMMKKLWKKFTMALFITQMIVCGMFMDKTLGTSGVFNKKYFTYSNDKNIQLVFSSSKNISIKNASNKNVPIKSRSNILKKYPVGNVRNSFLFTNLTYLFEYFRYFFQKSNQSSNYKYSKLSTWVDTKINDHSTLSDTSPIILSDNNVETSSSITTILDSVSSVIVDRESFEKDNSLSQGARLLDPSTLTQLLVEAEAQPKSVSLRPESAGRILDATDLQHLPRKRSSNIVLIKDYNPALSNFFEKDYKFTIAFNDNIL